jgi:hypothetical protein
MSTNTLFIFELILFNGAILAWAGYEWWSVRRSRHETGSSPREPRHAEREHGADNGRTEPPQ